MTRIDRVNIDYSAADLVAFKDMEKGQIYYNTVSHEYGIKLSPARFYSFRWECVYGFCNNRPNDSDRKHYLPVRDIKFVIARCFYCNEKCIDPHCNHCVVKERELRRLNNEDTNK